MSGRLVIPVPGLHPGNVAPREPTVTLQRKGAALASPWDITMTQSKRTILLAQALISGMMAALMTGTFGLLHSGASVAFLHDWGQSFITAWPIAFCFSLVVGPLAFRIATQVNRLFP